ncbi:hypothetical protein N752_08155 [Desulforamulus aquiferis]|nr:hypothetical protein N752_08155 [Desulforamulus aquiferis]
MHMDNKPPIKPSSDTGEYFIGKPVRKITVVVNT